MIFNKNEKVTYDDNNDKTYKLFFEITDGVEYFEFDKNKIDVYVNHTLVTYDKDGNKTKTHNRFEVRPCKDTDFMRNE